MPKIVAAILARNEAAPDRYLNRVLQNCWDLCDDVVVVDDGSTDETARMCRDSGAAVSQLGSVGGWWGSDETTPRSHLWTLAAKSAGLDGWVYVADADHELVGIDRRGLQVLCQADVVNAWAFPLWDCWDSDVTHRVDGYWQAWRHPRPWLVRAVPAAGWVAHWQTRDIHAGHLPANYPYLDCPAPTGVAIRHLGYVDRLHREAKAARYLALEPVTL